LTGIGVPAYFGPWEAASWQQLLVDRPAVAIINPDTGPGTAPQPAYRDLVRAATEEGIAVLGYSTTSWGNRPIPEGVAERDRYVEWYGVNGMFWDEVSIVNKSNVKDRNLAYYVAARECPSAPGRTEGVAAFNSGRSIPPSFFTRMPEAYWVTFEGTFSMHRQLFTRGRFEVEGPADRQWHLVHSVPENELLHLTERLVGAGLALAYVTTDKLPNPWDIYEPQFEMICGDPQLEILVEESADV
jgi:hypothetical protein